MVATNQLVTYLKDSLFYLVLFFSSSSFCLYFALTPSNIATVWFANAICALFLSQLPFRRWYLPTISMLIANLLADSLFRELSQITFILLTLNIIETCLIAFALRLFCHFKRCTQEPIYLIKSVFVCGLVPVINVAIPAAFLLSLSGLGEFNFLWITWLEGSGIGVIATLPLGFTLLTLSKTELTRFINESANLYLSIIVVFSVCGFVLFTPYPNVYLCVLLVTVALINGFYTVSLMTFLSGVVASILIAHGHIGPINNDGQVSTFHFYFALLLVLFPPVILGAARNQNVNNLQKIKQFQEQFKFLYEKTPAIFYSLDHQGKITHVSDLYLSVMGYERAEVVGESALIFLDVESQQKAVKHCLFDFDKPLPTQSLHLNFIKKDKSLINIALSATRYRHVQNQDITVAVLTDLTDKIRLEYELAQEKELLEVTLQSIGDGVVCTDVSGLITYINPVTEAILAKIGDEVVGKPFSEVMDLYNEDSGEKINDLIALCLSDRKIHGLPSYTNIRNHLGLVFSVQDSISPIYAKNGEIKGTVMVFQDVTERRAISRKISYIAQHDILTDLPNRQLFNAYLSELCDKGKHDFNQFAVVFIDLDNFKNINDSLGHHSGDELLIQVANRLKHNTRKDDMLCRMGGDEFVLLLNDVSSETSAHAIVQKVLTCITGVYSINRFEINLSVSAGVALFPENGDDVASLMKHADVAMYRAKRSGKGCFQFYTHALDTQAEQQLIVEKNIRDAIQANQFEPYFQPIVNASNYQLYKFEVLARWDKDGQIIEPNQFISISEETFLINDLGEMLLIKSFEQLKKWRDLNRVIYISINVSTVQLAENKFLQRVENALTQTGVSADWVEFEITESSLMADPDAMLVILNKLKNMGFKIAVDDFGTGYSSLSYLKKFPIDTLKIDREFVRDVQDDKNARSLVKAIIAIASSLSLECVAEGVETEAQAQILDDYGCTLLQGYLFSKPLSAKKANQFLVNAQNFNLTKQK